MTIKIIVLIKTIIINLFSTDIGVMGLKLTDKIRYKIFQRRVFSFIEHYVIEHDGTVLTKGVFERFLANYKPIEKAFDNISGIGEYVPKDQFIADQLRIPGS